jgi:hypothetical protein
MARGPWVPITAQPHSPIPPWPTAIEYGGFEYAALPVLARAFSLVDNAALLGSADGIITFVVVVHPHRARHPRADAARAEVYPKVGPKNSSKNSSEMS